MTYAATRSSDDERAKRNENGLRRTLESLSIAPVFLPNAPHLEGRHVRGTHDQRRGRCRQRRTDRDRDRAQGGGGVGGWAVRQYAPAPFGPASPGRVPVRGL